MARDVQAQCIVLAIAGVGNLHLTQHGSIEGTGSAQAVDAQGVVAAVAGCPLPVVDDAGRNGIEVDVGHLIGTHNHSHILLVESIYHRLQGVLVLVHVVAVELHDELAHVLAVGSQVPVTADAHVIVVGNNVDQTRVVILGDGLAGAVGREIVHHHQVKLEVALLLEHRVDGVADGADAVAHGNHHRCLDLKVTLIKLNMAEVGHLFAVLLTGSGQIAADFLEVLGAGLFHLDLAAAVARVNIIEDLLATLAGVQLNIAVEELVDVGNGGKLRQLEAQVIQTGELVVGLHRLDSLLEALATEEHHRAEIEVVTQATHLVVDNGSLVGALVGHVVVVGIEQARLGVVAQLGKTLQRERAHLQGVILGVEQHIIGIGMSSDFAHRGAREKHIDGEHLATLNRFGLIYRGKQVNLVHQFLSLEVLDGLRGLFGADKRNKAINSSHDCCSLYCYCNIEFSYFR